MTVVLTVVPRAGAKGQRLAGKMGTCSVALKAALSVDCSADHSAGSKAWLPVDRSVAWKVALRVAEMAAAMADRMVPKSDDRLAVQRVVTTVAMWADLKVAMSKRM